MARRRLGIWRRFAVMLVKPVMTGWTRRTWRGMEHLAGDQGIIIVANHLSHADPLVSAHFIYDAGRWPQYLGKASVFRVPGIGWLLHKCRQIPVERGSVEAVRSLDKLVDAVQSGGAVVIYPEGTTTREPDLWPMRAKTGAARLALTTGAPVIPVVMWGPEKLFDPRTKKLGLRPRLPVTVVAGPPVDLSRWADAAPTKTTLDEMTDEIMLRLRDMLAELRGETPPPLWAPPTRTATSGQPTVQQRRDGGTATSGLGGAA
ncbi:lysophospholipid acyltransferase family protein [Micromonospora polyrhachis]|uniref:1-acyl-sn-glycerol-3-phosphate acyltransferase n=1 Tax=Micromonospora polyrhachis TaxID=1282883 RepID=A0A7W7SMQ1_9ACTN|nr:lysophospholipid acyltransferase family protein [Micromonospora polyrhachis]MBB4957568.1 1-acyl-sn-glycerol-3-phosphate acyltransferase [Micromonospora polyrhachis]